jgi:hypothetical protein
LSLLLTLNGVNQPPPRPHLQKIPVTNESLNLRKGFGDRRCKDNWLRLVEYIDIGRVLVDRTSTVTIPNVASGRLSIKLVTRVADASFQVAPTPATGWLLSPRATRAMLKSKVQSAKEKVVCSFWIRLQSDHYG